MTLTHPVFTLDKPNPNPTRITDAEWWIWLRCHELEPASLLGGLWGDFKNGFHRDGGTNPRTNYSVVDEVNRTGPWWRQYGAALDWTFPDAQRGDYRTINKYTSRLMASARDPKDPRLDLILFEFYGQSDTDRVVEGYNEYREELATSDASHLWHIHFSFLRSKCGDFWAMWALLTVLMGWSVAQWNASLTSTGGEAVKLFKWKGNYWISRNDGRDGRETVTGKLDANGNPDDIGALYDLFVKSYPGAATPGSEKNGWPTPDLSTVGGWTEERVNLVFGRPVKLGAPLEPSAGGGGGGLAAHTHDVPSTSSGPAVPE